jgi:hypothetical protein
VQVLVQELSFDGFMIPCRAGEEIEERMNNYEEILKFGSCDAAQHHHFHAIIPHRDLPRRRFLS